MPSWQPIRARLENPISESRHSQALRTHENGGPSLPRKGNAMNQHFLAFNMVFKTCRFEHPEGWNSHSSKLAQLSEVA